MSDWERKEAAKKTSSVVLSLYNMLQETFSGQSFKITHQEAVLRQQNEFVVQVQRTSRKKEAGEGRGENGVLEKKLPNLVKPEAVFIQTLTMFYFQMRD